MQARLTSPANNSRAVRSRELRLAKSLYPRQAVSGSELGVTRRGLHHWNFGGSLGDHDIWFL